MPSDGSDYAPPVGPLDILHRDHDLLVAVKPAGLLSVPGKGAHLADCLEARLRAVDPAVLLVHRLDRDTSGVMVFARHPAAQRHLGLQFEKRRVMKEYVARVAGVVAEEAGEINLPLRADWPNRPRQMVAPDGRAASTAWRVLERRADETRLALQPRTGRSHQLRVHLLAQGHPILGDPLYAEGWARAHSRLMLHAERLAFRHPTGGAHIAFNAPCPF